ncbi:hypothetical protein ACFVEN_33050 [Streptomyces sp. NPDC057681]|uniref:hypothetical protein n=1 Tax=Streptomyces sp. NPDC057681 TaxID=3346209 RepID=UPI00368FF85F
MHRRNFLAAAAALAAAAGRGRPRHAATGATEVAVLATLRDAVRQAGADVPLLTTPLTEAECAGG